MVCWLLRVVMRLLFDGCFLSCCSLFVVVCASYVVRCVLCVACTLVFGVGLLLRVVCCVLVSCVRCLFVVDC